MKRIFLDTWKYMRYALNNQLTLANTVHFHVIEMIWFVFGFFYKLFMCYLHETKIDRILVSFQEFLMIF